MACPTTEKSTAAHGRADLSDVCAVEGLSPCDVTHADLTQEPTDQEASGELQTGGISAITTASCISNTGGGHQHVGTVLTYSGPQYVTVYNYNCIYVCHLLRRDLCTFFVLVVCILGASSFTDGKN